MTRVVESPSSFRGSLEVARAMGHRVGLVPTMGALHDGHLALVSEARAQGATFVAMSIFVNPTQFGPNEDFSRYPRTFEADLARCRDAKVDVVFAPLKDAMYPAGFASVVEVKGLTDVLEGVHRPGHFAGVTTIVCKLFGLAAPCVAVFGRKDYQQWKVIERMTRDLDLPVDVAAMPTIREPDGLALSSRNRYLSDEERVRALGIARGIRAAMVAFDDGERKAASLAAIARAEIEPAFDAIDYVAIADPETLQPVDRTGDRALLAVAAKIGKTRLIDNAVLGEDRMP
jgi:pantoate--beta-alanine ligase